MARFTRIPWTHATFNGWRGCWKISDGCKNCYAAAGSKRNPAVLGTWGKDGRRTAAAESYWEGPIRWNARAAQLGERQRVFALSYGDWLEDWDGPVHGVQGSILCRDRDHRWYLDDWSDGRPPGVVPLTLDDVRLRLLDTVRRTPELDWLLLSKRVGDWQRILTRTINSVRNTDRYDELIVWAADWLIGRPPANVWVGASVENQACADERLPALAAIPARVRWVSAEPLLEEVDFGGWEPELDWIVVGGESSQGGVEGRPFDVAWARSIASWCQSAGVAFYMKQMGARPYEWDACGLAPGSISSAALDSHLAMGGSEPDDVQRWLNLNSRSGEDLDEWPEDLRIRELPAIAEEVV